MSSPHLSPGYDCPVPWPPPEQIFLGHGEGGRLSRELLHRVVLTELAGAGPDPQRLADSAIVSVPGDAIAMTTDTFVVTPRFFPGGNIGSLAIYGTCNDLAVSGAIPVAMSLGLVIEEGFPLPELRLILAEIRQAAERCGVRIVTGDTKVVPRGMADGLFINTSGLGRVRPGLDLGPHRVQVGDAIIVSGPIAEHGLAVLAARERLFEGRGLQSDAAPVQELVALLLDHGVEVRFLRDPTRGGVAAVLHELVAQQPWGVEIDGPAVPVSETVRAGCELLGIEPLFVACEGRIVVVVPESEAEVVVQRLQSHSGGRGARVIARVTDSHPGRVQIRTAYGSIRPLVEPAGALLPRIC
jgi:hydrogenase expression/formation protein HypE